MRGGTVLVILFLSEHLELCIKPDYENFTACTNCVNDAHVFTRRRFCWFSFHVLLLYKWEVFVIWITFLNLILLIGFFQISENECLKLIKGSQIQIDPLFSLDAAIKWLMLANSRVKGKLGLTLQEQVKQPSPKFS